MKILLDNNIPLPLRCFLTEHEVFSAYQVGWAEKQNGELLKLAEQDGYELLVSGDQNIRYQQNLKGRNIGILILSQTKWSDVKPFGEVIKTRVKSMLPGEYAEIEIPQIKRRVENKG